MNLFPSTTNSNSRHLLLLRYYFFDLNSSLDLSYETDDNLLASRLAASTVVDLDCLKIFHLNQRKYHVHLVFNYSISAKAARLPVRSNTSANSILEKKCYLGSVALLWHNASVSTFVRDVRNSLSELEHHSTDSLIHQYCTQKLSPKIALHFKVLCESKAMLPLTFSTTLL